MKSPSHKWAFRPRFRTKAFGWRASKLASQRLKEATSEIKAVARKDPATAADGAILLMEKLWPALAHVDTSSGSLGNTVNRAVHKLIDIIVAAPSDESLREQWLERLWESVQEDGVDYLWEVGERWGELCVTPERASRAADDLVSIVRLSWSKEHRGYFRGTPACLSCLLAAGRHQELLDLAAELAHRSPVDIATLLRAARDHREKNPEFALNSATAALHWMAQGRFYEIKAGDVWQARADALETAAAVGRLEPTRDLIERLITSEETDSFVRKQLSQPFGLTAPR